MATVFHQLYLLLFIDEYGSKLVTVILRCWTVLLLTFSPLGNSSAMFILGFGESD